MVLSIEFHSVSAVPTIITACITRFLLLKLFLLCTVRACVLGCTRRCWSIISQLWWRWRRFFWVLSASTVTAAAAAESQYRWRGALIWAEDERKWRRWRRESEWHLCSNDATASSSTSESRNERAASAAGDPSRRWQQWSWISRKNTERHQPCCK